jgi:ERF superfamily
MSAVKKVYEAINKVQAELSCEGISKSKKNAQQGYQFRGIDDIYNVVSSVVAKHGLSILPRVLSRTVDERQSKSGGTLFYVTVHVEFDLVASEDGSMHTISTFGEAMDSADKATNKAMSAAEKYACIMAFMIPTEGDNDADSQTHEVKPSPAKLKDVCKPQEAKKEFTESQIADATIALNDCKTMSELKDVFTKLSPAVRERVESVKDKVKAALTVPVPKVVSEAFPEAVSV